MEIEACEDAGVPRLDPRPRLLMREDEELGGRDRVEHAHADVVGGKACGMPRLGGVRTLPFVRSAEPFRTSSGGGVQRGVDEGRAEHRRADGAAF